MVFISWPLLCYGILTHPVSPSHTRRTLSEMVSANDLRPPAAFHLGYLGWGVQVILTAVQLSNKMMTIASSMFQAPSLLLVLGSTLVASFCFSIILTIEVLSKMVLFLISCLPLPISRSSLSFLLHLPLLETASNAKSLLREMKLSWGKVQHQTSKSDGINVVRTSEIPYNPTT